MFVKLSILLIFLLASLVAVNAQRIIDGEKLGIVNGKATFLPKPDYPQEAKDFCASGKVEVEVLISENGNVIETKAISGDELLRVVSVEAVKKAKFSPTPEIRVKTKGIVVYNFDSFAKCLNVGVVNKNALFVPKPEFPKGCRCAGTVKVEVIIDILSGKVTKARAISGHPLLRISAVNSAKQATFSPSLINSRPIYAKGFLVYKF